MGRALPLPHLDIIQNNTVFFREVFPYCRYSCVQLSCKLCHLEGKQSGCGLTQRDIAALVTRQPTQAPSLATMIMMIITIFNVNHPPFLASHYHCHDHLRHTQVWKRQPCDFPNRAGFQDNVEASLITYRSLIVPAHQPQKPNSSISTFILSVCQRNSVSSGMISRKMLILLLGNCGTTKSFLM